MSPRPIRVALIGAGNMARQHALAFRDVSGVVLSGIYSRTRERAEKLAGELGFESVSDSVEELYEKAGADLVVIAVNMLDIFPVAISALRYPWTIMVEKPAGADLAEAEELAQAASKHGRVYVALNRRFYASTLAALEDLSGRDDARHIHVSDQQDLAAAAALGHPPRVITNWMFGNSIHLIDYFRIFGRGSVASVDPVIRWNPDRPGVVVAKVSFDSGDTGIYEGFWNGPGPWSVTLHTPARRWELRPLERGTYQDRGDRVVHELAPQRWDLDFKAGFRRQAEEAVAAARGETTQLATIAQSLQSMRLVAAIFS